MNIIRHQKHSRYRIEPYNPSWDTKKTHFRVSYEPGAMQVPIFRARIKLVPPAKRDSIAEFEDIEQQYKFEADCDSLSEIIEAIVSQKLLIEDGYISGLFTFSKAHRKLVIGIAS